METCPTSLQNTGCTFLNDRLQNPLSHSKHQHTKNDPSVHIHTSLGREKQWLGPIAHRPEIFTPAARNGND
jgi:hypothetical protein